MRLTSKSRTCYSPEVASGRENWDKPSNKGTKNIQVHRGQAPRNILRSRVPEIPFSAFWGGNLTQLRKRHISHSPVAPLLLFTTVTKILHSLTQTLLIVDALVCWSCHEKGHKARQYPKKRGTFYVPFSCCDVTFYMKLVQKKN